MLFFSRSKILMIQVAVFIGLVLVIANLWSERTAAAVPQVSKTPINLALDERGGLEMLLEVDQPALLNKALINERRAINDAFRWADDRPRTEFVRTDGDDSILVRLRSKEDTDKALPLVQALSQPVDPTQITSAKTTRVVRVSDRNIRVTITEENIKNILKPNVARSIEMFRCRIDPNSTRDLNFVLVGDKRFLMQIPAVQNLDDLLPRHSGFLYNVNLSFHLVNEEAASSDQARRRAVETGRRLPPGEIFYPFAASSGKEGGLIVTKRTRITMDCMKDFSAVPAYRNREAGTIFSFNAHCTEAFGSMTAQNIGKRYAVVLDGEIIAAPTIRSAVRDGKGFFEANFTDKSAEGFACRVKAGAFPVKLIVVEERNFPPS